MGFILRFPESRSIPPSLEKMLPLIPQLTRFLIHRFLEMCADLKLRITMGLSRSS